MTTAAQLRTHTAKDLAALAKKKEIPGWHAMRKDELVRSLANKFRAEAARKARRKKAQPTSASRNGTKASAKPKAAKVTAKTRAKANGSSKNGKASTNGAKVSTNGAKASTNGSRRNGKVAVVAGKNGNGSANGQNGAKNGVKNGAKNGAANGAKNGVKRSKRVMARIDKVSQKLNQSKDLAYAAANGKPDHEKDRLIVMVRDSYWLHAYWELTRRSIERARAAMGQHWHGARPILRLMEVTSEGTASTVKTRVRDIEIHGGVNNWYVDVQDPPKSYQMDIGYRAVEGNFYSLSRSNVVTTPQAGAIDAMDGNWREVAEDFDRIYALSGGYEEKAGGSDLKDLFEKRLRRPMSSPMVTRFGRGAQMPGGRKDLPFSVDAELIVFGSVDPSSHLTLKGEPVRLQPDGTFSVRFNMPERRQVLPVVCSSNDGVEQRTIVLAVERNTKVMEPVVREPNT